MDGGLTEEQKEYFQSNNISILDPGWRNETAKKKSRGREYLKINVAKMHLDVLFPEADVILWVDGDTWFQTAKAIEYFLLVASKNKLGIVSQSNRNNVDTIGYKNWLGKFVELRNILYKSARGANLPSHLKNLLKAKSTLNAGAFALNRNAPHWERFRYWQNKIMRRGRVFTSDQLAIGLTVYSDSLPYEVLPEICNYFGKLRWNESINQFVELYIPNEPISIMHLAGLDNIRKDQDLEYEMLDMNDKIIKKKIRFQR